MTTKKARIKTNDQAWIHSPETGTWIALPERLKKEELAKASDIISPPMGEDDSEKTK